MEAVAEVDDDLTEKYLEGEEITRRELVTALKSGVTSGLISPVVAMSSAKNIGTDRVLAAIVDFLPSPASAQPHTRWSAR